MPRRSRTKLLMDQGRKEHGHHTKQQCADVRDCPLHRPENRR